MTIKDKDTYQCFLKVKDNIHKLPRVYQLYEQACRRNGKHITGSDCRIYDRELNYALTIYIGEVLKNPAGIKLQSPSGNTFSVVIENTIYSFIVEKISGEKILTNYIEVLSDQSISSDEITWHNRMQCNGYLMNTHTAYIKFNKVKENKKRNFYQVIEERFEQFRECSRRNGKDEFPLLNTKASFQMGQDLFTIMIAYTNDLPKNISRSNNQIIGFEAREDIPIFLVLDYEYNEHMSTSCMNV